MCLPVLPSVPHEALTLIRGNAAFGYAWQGRATRIFVHLAMEGRLSKAAPVQLCALTRQFAEIVICHGLTANAPSTGLNILDGDPGDLTQAFAFDRKHGFSHLPDHFLLLG